MPVIDSFEFAGANSVPSTVSLDIRWERTGPFKELGHGNSVPASDPGAFLGKIAPARASGRISGIGPGFEFTARGTSRDGYAEFGFEKNGNFL